MNEINLTDDYNDELINLYDDLNALENSMNQLLDEFAKENGFYPHFDKIVDNGEVKVIVKK